MKKLITIILVLVCILPALAKIVVERHDGKLTVLGQTETLDELDGVFTLGGINVADIKQIYNNPNAEQEPSEPIVPGSNRIKRVAVLDMNERNKVAEASEDGRYLYSAEYMMQLAGIPYFVTESLQDAMANASMILFAGNIGKKTFTDAEYNELMAWVEEGGVIVAPAIEFKDFGKCFEMFGLSAVNPKQKTHTLMKWHTDEQAAELAYIDTDEERDTYLGENYIFTSIYTPDGAEVLATYDDSDEAAVIKHTIGHGCIYSVGVRWRDVIQRNQLNKGGSDRIKNNHFEASADVFPLFVRACYVANSPVTVWKHTIPDGYETVLIPTHDCDSRTAYDEMHWIAEYEKSVGLSAHFFLTTHYFRQPSYLSAFYNEETVPAARALLKDGHTVGSHSVCHLPDFSTTDRFPLTVTTPDEYAATCTYDIDTKTTTGGSTWAEVVMSKQIIERDLGNSVRSFRSGHLCVNANIPEALSMGSYSFTSCYSATDLRGSFPFFQRMGVKWTGDLSSVLQMPLHFSDVRPTGVNMTAEEIEGTMPVWMEYHEKLMGNYAPNILLIHPNAKWKMEAERNFVNMLDRNRVGLYNFEAYGDFWINRLAMDYEYEYVDGEVRIFMNGDVMTRYAGQGLFVETKQPVSRIIVADSEGRVLRTRLIKLADGKYIAVI